MALTLNKRKKEQEMLWERHNDCKSPGCSTASTELISGGFPQR